MAIRVSVKKARELGIIPKAAVARRGMNALEERYAAHLDDQKFECAIEDWRFEWYRFILYHGLPGEQREASYKMDFLIVKNVPYLDWFTSYEIKPNIILPVWERLEIHEVKGHWRSRDRIRIKIAAELNPWYTFYGVTWNRESKEWEYERF